MEIPGTVLVRTGAHIWEIGTEQLQGHLDAVFISVPGLGLPDPVAASIYSTHQLLLPFYYILCFTNCDPSVLSCAYWLLCFSPP
ncbi:hypothetical protein GDO81_025461 [Engystomops pustulosus]|uniref:Uncharacterized protein n=1 Tax=Engystomops pustulosus TaxID=76066 RepID=A0AAV6Z4H0_ENGPU|nr:hypothetical protein GDO81_025461 [Engystomops pustulosus]